MSRTWHLASSSYLWGLWCGPVSHIVIVSGMHSPTIFRCLEIIMITSLLPHDVRGPGDTYWWSGHLTWLHSIDTPPHTASIVSAHYYYNNPILSPHSLRSLSLVTWHAMGGSVPSPGVPPWSPTVVTDVSPGSPVSHQCQYRGWETDRDLFFCSVRSSGIAWSVWFKLS